MTAFKRSQYKYVKKRYKTRNWAEYEAGLRNRGSLTIWLGLEIGQNTIPGWNLEPSRKRKPGGQGKYSDYAIEMTAKIAMLFKLASRQSEGFLLSIFSLLKLQNDVPDHTTICRRKAVLGKVDMGIGRSNKPVNILIDSSGLKVHVGSFRIPRKKRDYRKIHIGVDEKNGDIISCDLTSKNVHDSKRVPSILNQVSRPIRCLKADAAYDKKIVYKSINNHNPDRTTRIVIPSIKNAKIGGQPEDKERDRNIRSRKRQGKREWQNTSGYNKRSLVENAFFRYKTIIGPSMQARKLSSQRVEARLGCNILNQMIKLGMPKSQMLE